MHKTIWALSAAALLQGCFMFHTLDGDVEERDTSTRSDAGTIVVTRDASDDALPSARQRTGVEGLYPRMLRGYVEWDPASRGMWPLVYAGAPPSHGRDWVAVGEPDLAGRYRVDLDPGLYTICLFPGGLYHPSTAPGAPGTSAPPGSPSEPPPGPGPGARIEPVCAPFELEAGDVARFDWTGRTWSTSSLLVPSPSTFECPAIGACGVIHARYEDAPELSGSSKGAIQFGRGDGSWRTNGMLPDARYSIELAPGTYRACMFLYERDDGPYSCTTVEIGSEPVRLDYCHGDCEPWGGRPFEVLDVP